MKISNKYCKTIFKKMFSIFADIILKKSSKIKIFES